MTEGAYAEANGVRMYYEVSGAGDPLLLLHGGFGGTHAFGAQVPAFSERFRVYVPEQRGRGRTADSEGPITYQLMVDDTVAFLERTVSRAANIVGVSDGGIIGLLMAIQRSELVRKLVTVGSNFHGDGLLSSAMWTEAGPDDEAWAGPRARYAAVSPDGPEHFSVVFAKLQQMWRYGQPTLTASDLSQIDLPVLVVAADDDVVDHRHSADFYEALPHGQLAIIPGASHAVFMEKPDLLNWIVLDFLTQEGEPQTILPVRRAARVV